MRGVTEKVLKMSHPLEEKGHWDPWTPGKAAAAEIQVRDSQRVGDTGHPPREVSKKTEEILLHPY